MRDDTESRLRQRFDLYHLALTPVHWYLFGIDKAEGKCYFLEIVGNNCTHTKCLKIQTSRSLWRRLKREGAKQIMLQDAGSIPSHVHQRLKEWSIFTISLIRNSGHGGGQIPHEPWIRDPEEKDSVETLGRIVNSRFTPEDDELPRIVEYAPSIGDWQDSDVDSQDEIDQEESSEDADFDNYWNREGVFEQETNMYADEVD